MKGERYVDTRSINVLSICSGYGGIELGLESVIPARTVCYVENEIGVASILAARMEDGSLDPAPIWTDLRTFDPEPWRGKVDILAGGFPCQPHSVAGNRLGEDDPRELSGEVLRIAAGLGYPTIFLENVPGIMRFYYDNIRPSLQEMGYTTTEGLFTASETGAPHKRQRLFILANSGEPRIWDQARTPRGSTRVKDVRQGDGALGTVRPSSTGPELAHARCVQRSDCRGISPLAEKLQTGETDSSTPCSTDELADTNRAGPQGWDECRDSAGERSTGTSGTELGELPLYPPAPNDHEGWAYMLSVMPEAQPTFCRDAHGATAGVERRLRAVGNGVVPAVAALAWQSLSRAL